MGHIHSESVAERRRNGYKRKKENECDAQKICDIDFFLHFLTGSVNIFWNDLFRDKFSRVKWFHANFGFSDYKSHNDMNQEVIKQDKTKWFIFFGRSRSLLMLLMFISLWMVMFFYIGITVSSWSLCHAMLSCLIIITFFNGFSDLEA